MEAVQPYLDQAWVYLNDLIGLMRGGYNNVNAAQGLVVAIFATVLMKEWKQIWPTALTAVLAHLVLDVLVPVMAGIGSFRLPPVFDQSFWIYVITLYPGYVVVLALLFLVKKYVFRA